MAIANPHETSGYQIGQAARLSGVSTPNIRYYEKEKLLSRQIRSANSYRMYSDADVHQLRFIRLCRAMDMSLDEVRVLLSLDLADLDDCNKARDALDAHLGHVRERLLELHALENDLADLRQRCDGSTNNCKIMEALHLRADQSMATNKPSLRVKKHV